jgi:pimeloyl-ACP methyl ester carboxylesterase
MTYKTKFHFIDNKSLKTTILIPGWATDYRVLNTEGIKTNLLLIDHIYPNQINKDLKEKIKELQGQDFSLIGFSLGGFIAIDFANKYPDKFRSVTVIGIREKYSALEIQTVKNFINRSKKGFLTKFYQNCFYDKNKFNKFKDILLDDYINKFSLDYLIDTLDYLERQQITAKKLTTIKNINIFHGQEDQIAPLKEIKSLADPKTLTELKNEGHILSLEIGRLAFK